MNTAKGYTVNPETCTCLSISRDPLCAYHGDVDKVNASGTMQILQIAQGRDGVGLDGRTLDEALAALREADEAFLEKYPHCRKYHSPAWRVIEAKAGERAPWGTEWWAADECGVLRMHSAQYDSSG